MNALEAAKVAEAALEDKLGEDIKVLDLRGLSNIADCFVIASGKNANQLHAMANVHLFNREEREFYGLDHVWGDAKAL